MGPWNAAAVSIAVKQMTTCSDCMYLVQEQGVRIRVLSDPGGFREGNCPDEREAGGAQVCSSNQAALTSVYLCNVLWIRSSGPAATADGSAVLAHPSTHLATHPPTTHVAS